VAFDALSMQSEVGIDRIATTIFDLLHCHPCCTASHWHRGTLAFKQSTVFKKNKMTLPGSCVVFCIICPIVRWFECVFL
jgi:hypothetical protein